MDYAKEYDRMVEQSNKQQERIEELETAYESSATRAQILGEQLAASQAREQMLRNAIFNTASACRIWGGEAERARKMLEHSLSTPSDDTALRECGAKLLEEMAVELGCASTSAT